jgi:hypothetical protein
MRCVWLLIAVVGCYRSSPTSAPPTPPGASLFVYGGRDGVDATLVDLAATPDGRVLALACANGLVALRWDRTGKRVVEQQIGDSCERTRLLVTGNDEVIVADSLCRGSTTGDPEGCVRVRRFDPTLATTRWTVMPKLSVLFALALGGDDKLVVGGWRMRPHSQDPTTTDLHVYDAAGAQLRTHELLSNRTDPADVHFVGDDLLVVGFVEPDRTTKAFTIDGTAHPIANHEAVFVARLGARPWFVDLEQIDVELYNPPVLTLPDRTHAVLVAMARPREVGRIPMVGYAGSETIELAMRIELATGKLAGGAHRKAGEFGERITDVELTANGIVMTKPIERPARSRRGTCRDDEPCSYSNGPEAHGNTMIPAVYPIDSRTLELGSAITRYRGHAFVSGAMLAYASRERALYLGASLAGTLTLGTRTIATEQVRDDPCKDAQSSTRAPRIILASVPPRDPCTVEASYTSAVFITRVN